MYHVKALRAWPWRVPSKPVDGLLLYSVNLLEVRNATKQLHGPAVAHNAGTARAAAATATATLASPANSDSVDLHQTKTRLTSV